MRMGAIFARGSCRALKWMALFGVVFALGAGSAAAQITAKMVESVEEGDAALITVTAKVSYPEGAIGAGTITVTATPAAAGSGEDNTYETQDISLNPGFVTLSYTARTAEATDRTATLSGSIRVSTVEDPDAEDEKVSFTLAATGDTNVLRTQDDPPGNIGSAVALEDPLTITDRQTQTYVLALAPDDQKPTENGVPVTVSVTAVPAHVDGMAELRLHLDDPMYTVDILPGTADIDSGAVTLGSDGNAEASAADNTTTVAITVPTNDKNRAEDTVMLSVFSGTAGNAKNEGSLAIDVADAHELPEVTVTAIVLDEDGDPVDPQPDMVESIEEGEMIDLKVTVVNKDGDADKAEEPLMVSLMPTGDADDQDYRLSPDPIAVELDEMTGTARLTASENPDLGMEMLMFDAAVAGLAANGTETRMSAGVLSLEITDKTRRQVEALPEEDLMPIIYGAIDEGDGDDDKFNPGEKIELDASTLFKPTEYSISYSVDSDMMDVADPRRTGSMVTVEALMAGGPAHITITATATGMTSGAKPLPQTSPTFAQVIFPVTVVDTPLVVTVSTDPMDMVDEGGMVKVTATSTTRDILAGEEAVVMLDVNGPATGPDSITIPAGMKDGSIDLMVNDDEMVAPMGDIVITATGAGIEGAQVLTVSVTEDDMETTYSVAPAAVSVTEGGEGMMITATASQAVLANTEVMLMHGAGSASADDYGLVPVMITIMAGETEGSTMLTATDDDDYEGMEAVTLNAMIGTMSVGMVEVTIEDDDMPTTYELAPATGMVDEGGEAAVITATASQAVMEDTMVSLTPTGGTASADDYSVDAITIMAGETSGSTMLMANDDYDVEGMETLTLQGSIGSMIIGSVMFEIGDNDMEITVELSSEDEHIVEGDMDHANGTKAAAVLTATASSAVPMDTVVTIMRDGTSSAGMDDFTAEPITISAGETMGTTMVMAGEDGIMEDMEMLTLYGMVDGMNTNMVSFYIWDAAVPALPLIAQFLLAAFLAIGGYRRYLRR